GDDEALAAVEDEHSVETFSGSAGPGTGQLAAAGRAERRAALYVPCRVPVKRADRRTPPSDRRRAGRSAGLPLRVPACYERRVKRDKPWVMRTYSGHSSARASNELYRLNLSKGQTGLSVAFDLPTQTGYDSDDPLAAGEVGKVGVPIGHIADMEALFAGIPLGEMNTSMTINGTAAWLPASYGAAAERQGAKPKLPQGPTQNDIIKEYLPRGTYISPPAPSMRLTADVITYAVKHIPKWNPINVCSYHLQEAGAT